MRVKSDRDAWYGGQGKSLRFTQYSGGETRKAKLRNANARGFNLSDKIITSTHFHPLRFFSTPQQTLSVKGIENGVLPPYTPIPRRTQNCSHLRPSHTGPRLKVRPADSPP